MLAPRGEGHRPSSSSVPPHLDPFLPLSSRAKERRFCCIALFPPLSNRLCDPPSHPIPSHGIPTHFPSQCQCPAAPTLLPLPTLGLQHSRESPKLWPWCRFFCYCATTTSQLPIKLCLSIWHCFMARMMGEFFFFFSHLLQQILV